MTNDVYLYWIRACVISYHLILLTLLCWQAIGVTADPTGKGVILSAKKTKCKLYGPDNIIS